MKRYLAHGPCLNDPNDLLFFDAWIEGSTAPQIRPSNLRPGYGGYPIPEPWPQELRDALAANGCIVTPGDLLWSGTGAKMAISDSGLPTVSPALMAEVAAMADAGQFITLHTPASAVDERAWFTQIDRALRDIAARLTRLGHCVASKQFADSVTRTFRPGWTPALALVLPAFPRIDHAVMQPDALCALLADAGTVARREALYAWPQSLGQTDRPLVAVIDQVSAAAADYAAWVEASGLASGTGRVELLWALDDPAQADALAALRVADTDAAVARLDARGLAEGETSGARNDTPLALVSPRPRGYPGS